MSLFGIASRRSLCKEPVIRVVIRTRSEGNRFSLVIPNKLVTEIISRCAVKGLNLRHVRTVGVHAGHGESRVGIRQEGVVGTRSHVLARTIHGLILGVHLVIRIGVVDTLEVESTRKVLRRRRLTVSCISAELPEGGLAGPSQELVTLAVATAEVTIAIDGVVLYLFVLRVVEVLVDDVAMTILQTKLSIGGRGADRASEEGELLVSLAHVKELHPLVGVTSIIPIRTKDTIATIDVKGLSIIANKPHLIGLVTGTSNHLNGNGVI